MEDSSFSLDQLQPGRNYSVVVAAVSNNIDSNNNEPIVIKHNLRKGQNPK